MLEPADKIELRQAIENRRAELKLVLNREGLRGAIMYLNSLTKCRFTSLYRFDGPRLCNIIFYDRENPHIKHSEDLPVLASYCVFVRDSRAAFQISHAELDERVKGHPKQNSVQCYCGVPLIDEDGKMFGTVCHFDVSPGVVNHSDVDLLEYFGDLIRPKFSTYK